MIIEPQRGKIFVFDSHQQFSFPAVYPAASLRVFTRSLKQGVFPIKGQIICRYSRYFSPPLFFLCSVSLLRPILGFIFPRRNNPKSFFHFLGSFPQPEQVIICVYYCIMICLVFVFGPAGGLHVLRPSIGLRRLFCPLTREDM